MIRRILLALLLCSSVAWADYISTVAADSPVNFWYLDEPSGTTATDHGSSPANGAYQASPTLNQTCQISGHNCPSFNGTTQWVQVGGNIHGKPSTNDISAECWVKFSSIAATNSNIIGSAQTGSSCGSDEIVGWVMRGPRTSPPTFLWNIGDGACSTYLSVAGTTNLTTGVWYLTTGTYKHTASQRSTIYLNGVQEAQTTTTTGSPTAILAAGFMAARNITGTADQFLPGNLQMCATFSSELSSARVLAHYNAGTAPASDPSWPYITQKPGLPQFRNAGYYDRLMRAGYNTGLFDLSVKFPRYFTVGYLPFEVVPNGRGQ